MSETPNRTLAAFGAILIYATIIAYTDNYVRVIAQDAGLWQFHATRTAMAFALLAILAMPLGLRLRPKNPRAVVARSLIHGSAMLIYFGALAFLPVAQVAAGLFTAPIFVLLIQRLVYGLRISRIQVLAVAVGFAGVVLVLGREAVQGATLAALLPVISGALYAMGNIATRQWCEGESAEVLVAGFFGILGVFGLIGMVMLAVFPVPVAEGAAGFVQRGAVWPSGTFLWWTFVQAAGSLLGVGMFVKAYQMAEASRVAVFEYVILPASAAWGYLLWGERLTWLAAAGMALIVLAGVLIARPSGPQSPTASRQ
ncbi:MULTISPECIES: DMT family transporter [Tabrizicola]|uniref:DMT family transporter n=1 Tax=Tabrizicola TaxID=1443919 RepID=UPI0010814D71|nr:MULTISPECIES: DMT family transporter [Paracoccaceae]